MRKEDSLDGVEDGLEHGLVEVAGAVAAAQVPHEVVHGHRHVELLRVVVVLVHVQHYDGVRQPERRVGVSERLAVRGLWPTDEAIRLDELTTSC